MSILNKLTEGIVRRDLSKEGTCSSQQSGKRLVYLEGLTNGRTSPNTEWLHLLENQAKELLREASYYGWWRR